MDKLKEALQEIKDEIDRKDEIPRYRVISNIEDILNDLLICENCGCPIDLEDIRCIHCDEEIYW